MSAAAEFTTDLMMSDAHDGLLDFLKNDNIKEVAQELSTSKNLSLAIWGYPQGRYWITWNNSPHFVLISSFVARIYTLYYYSCETQYLIQILH